MKIILDAMGGDLAPKAAVEGAVLAAEEFQCEIVLVGRGDELLSCLNELGLDTLPKGIEIAHAESVVEMEDDPTSVLRTKKDSSMVTGLKMLADGGGDAFVSSGNSGALLTCATLLVKRMKGVRRAAFAPEIPVKGGRKMLLMDCGANVECTPDFLLQFAVVGSEYAKKAFGLDQPRVSLLNNGTEDCKGTSLQMKTYRLLQAADEKGLIHFIGNMEAREAMLGGTDVLITDGFSGNIMLKSVEGTALFLMSRLKSIFSSTILTKLGYMLVSKEINSLKALLDYRETGGTLVLGIKRPVIKAHGSSDARAFRSAIRQAIVTASYQLEGELAEKLQQLSEIGGAEE